MENVKILLVEDSLINCYVMSNMLTALGHQADMVENGQQALDRLEQEEYDLVFMDCDMPVLDGYATTKEIRHREQAQGKPAVRIVALTAHLSSEHRQECKAAGMNDYLSKPIHLNTLRTLLDQWLTSATIAPAAPEEIVTPSLDEQILKQLEEVMGREMTIQLAQTFMEYAPQQLITLQQLATNNERDRLRRKAHQLKGETSQLGATRMSEICKEIETLAQAGSQAVIITCLAKLQTELTHVREALTQVTHNDG
jgi:CheY-like chemotaxis protein/HPt (histidine-containing phosphotransfer) domain-containing protein